MASAALARRRPGGETRLTAPASDPTVTKCWLTSVRQRVHSTRWTSIAAISSPSIAPSAYAPSESSTSSHVNSYSFSTFILGSKPLDDRQIGVPGDRGRQSKSLPLVIRASYPYRLTFHS